MPTLSFQSRMILPMYAARLLRMISLLRILFKQAEREKMMLLSASYLPLAQPFFTPPILGEAPVKKVVVSR